MTEIQAPNTQLKMLLDLYSKLHFLTLRIHNAAGAPDPTESNSTYRLYVLDLLTWFAKEAERMGVVYLKRHTSCGHPLHHEDMYVIENNFGLSIDYELSIGEGHQYQWVDMNLGQKKVWSDCACGGKNGYQSHTVIPGIVRKTGADIEAVNKLAAILIDLHNGVELASLSRPRSAIRERLLRALLKVIDLLLPTSMEYYVSHLQTLVELRGPLQEVKT